MHGTCLSVGFGGVCGTLNKDCYSYLASHTDHRASLAMKSSGWLWRFKSLEGLWIEDFVDSALSSWPLACSISQTIAPAAPLL